MPLDPTTPAGDDHPHEEPLHPDAERRAGSREPVDESGEEPIRTLLWTAATYRPLEEVAALVMLLKRTGEVPNPGDEALRVAAVARPIDEVMQLVAMLNEPPHEIDEADTTLRAVAVGRPIEEVAQLVAYLGTHENEPPFATAHRDVGRGEPSPTLFGRPGEEDPRDTRTHDTHTHDTYSRDPEHDDRDGFAERAAHAARGAGAGHTAPWTSAPAGPPREVPSLAPPADGRPPAGSRERTASFAPHSPLRSPLRRPAAAALFACGVLHLPTDVAGLRSGGYAEAVSLCVTVLCLVFGVRLAVADTARVWAAGAATAVGIIVAHTLSGLGSVDLLRSGPGGDLGWATPVAVGCAAVALLFSGLVLMVRQRVTAEAERNAARKAVQRAPRRPAPTTGTANDA
ncbi:hypothetical protein P3L51_22685 [Streptomyces sp. PSRA5]|uniref:hypothetical protein n=1 Tax=Streptomyces panacea TaxID=3035064 RepID=UPI00339CA1C0